MKPRMNSRTFYWRDEVTGKRFETVAVKEATHRKHAFRKAGHRDLTLIQKGVS